MERLAPAGRDPFFPKPALCARSATLLAVCHLPASRPADLPEFFSPEFFLSQIDIDSAWCLTMYSQSTMKTITTRSSKRHTLSCWLPIAALVVFSWTQTACVHQSSRQISPSYSAAKISNLRSFYVRQHNQDDHNLAGTIADELRQMGYTATHGTTQSPPRRVDAVVTYTDRWMWDITMYMLSLDMQLREPGSDVALASAKTVRSSLVRKSAAEMAHETLAKILGKEEKP
jgi:hypothetical protein